MPGSDASGLPSRDDLTAAWGDVVLPSLRVPVRAFLGAGRFVAVEAGTAVYALPDAPLLPRAETVKGEAEAALSAHFGRPVAMRLVHEPKTASPTPGTRSVPLAGVPAPEVRTANPAPDDDTDDPQRYDLDELRDASPAVVSPEQRLLEAFPGTQEVNP